MMVEKLVEWWLAGETEVFRENLPQRALSAPQTPHAVRTRTRAATVGSQRLTAWATARPTDWLTKIEVSPYQALESHTIVRRRGSHIILDSLLTDGCEIVSLKRRPPLPTGPFLIFISIRGRVTLRAIVRLEELDQLKNRMVPSGIEPATFRLVAECLNQLRFRVTY
jgi:hypothetical protein